MYYVYCICILCIYIYVYSLPFTYDKLPYTLYTSTKLVTP